MDCWKSAGVTQKVLAVGSVSAVNPSHPPPLMAVQTESGRPENPCNLSHALFSPFCNFLDSLNFPVNWRWHGNGIQGVGKYGGKPLISLVSGPLSNKIGHFVLVNLVYVKYACLLMMYFSAFTVFGHERIRRGVIRLFIGSSPVFPFLQHASLLTFMTYCTPIN